MSNKWLILTILSLSIATRFIFFGHPSQTVFDEVHFGKFVSAYYTHEYYFDIHPPLGKLIIAGFGKLADFSPEYSFSQIGEKFQDNKYMALRFLPSLAGALLPLVLFFLALEIGFSRRTALLAGLLLVFENGIITQSRFVLMDAFLLLFGFCSLLFYFRYRNHNGLINLFLAGIFSAFAISIKWTGLTFLAIIATLELITLLTKYKDSLCTKTVFVWGARNLMFLLVVPFLIYFSAFAIHFSLLGRSGDGDAFMSSEFQKTLAGNSNHSDQQIKEANTIEKFSELNHRMYTANKTLTSTHSYSSEWYTWPFLIRPIYYWVSDEARIYFMGNPIIWWLSTMAMLVLILRTIQYAITNPKTTMRNRKKEILLIGAFAINFLPFIFIGRVMFLYHYLSAIIFAILALAYTLDKESPRKLIMAIIILSALSFIYFSPLTYGLSMSRTIYESHIWLPSWE